MSRLTVSGLASNLDWKRVVEEIGRLERQSLVRLEDRRSEAQRRAGGWTEVRGRLEDLRTRLRALMSPSLAAARKVVGGVPGEVEAAAGAGTPPGTYQIRVMALADAHRVRSAAVADAGEPLGLEGTFRLNGHELAVRATDTLVDLAGMINAAGVEVRASVVKVAEGQHCLVLASERTGLAHALSLEDGSAGVLAALGLVDGEGEANTLTPAQDARFYLNGLELGRSSNTVTDAVPGLTIRLGRAGAEASLEVVPDRDAVVEAVAAFVAAYNAVLRTARSGAAAADSHLVRVVEGLRRAATSRGGAGDFDELWDVGLSTAADRSGELGLDRNRLLAALEHSPEAVVSLLAGEGDSPVARLRGYVDGLLRPGDGTVALRTRWLGELTTSLGREMERVEERLRARGEMLTRQFLAMERFVGELGRQSNALAIPLAWLGARDYRS